MTVLAASKIHHRDIIRELDTSPTKTLPPRAHAGALHHFPSYGCITAPTWPPWLRTWRCHSQLCSSFSHCSKSCRDRRRISETNIDAQKRKADLDTVDQEAELEPPMGFAVGVFQTSIHAQKGKVTVSGPMDSEMVIKKLKKIGKPTQLWGANPAPAVVTQVERLQLGGGGGGGGAMRQPMGGAGAASSSNGLASGASMGMPQATPQQLHQMQLLRQQMQMKQMAMGGKMPFPTSAPPTNPKAVKFLVPEEVQLEGGGL